MLTDRLSGILLHPTSFPSRYGIGDLGTEAYNFIDFLYESNQKLWQILPLGSVNDSYSPYQSTSAFAGNFLLISLEKLVDEGLLNNSDLEELEFVNHNINYEEAKKIKSPLLHKAYDNFDFHSFSNNKYFNQINTKKIIIESTLIKKNYDNSFQSAIYESNSDFINSSISDKKDALKNYTQVLEDIKNRNNTFSEGLYYYIVEDYIIGYVSIESKYEKEKSESSEEELISYETQSLLEIEQTIEQIEDDIINLENEKETIQRKLEGLSNDYIDELACKIIINEEIDLSYSLIENCDSEIKQNEFYQRQLIQEKEQSVVCATCEGTIDYKIEANINEYLTTGMAVAEVITNKREDIIVEAYVNNDDIGKIEVGMKVNCDIYAYPASEYGYITGEIVEIHNKNNDGKYTVLIDLTTVDVKTRQGDTYSLRDGLEGEVKIITDRKSILFYLIDKIDVFDDIGIE